MIQEFLKYLKYERNLSQRTVDSYGEDLKIFQKYCEALDEPIPLESADSDAIRGWIEAMMDRGDKPASVNRRLSALHCFYRFAVKHKFVAKDPSCGIVGPKKSKPVPAFVREKDMQRLLDGEEMWNATLYKDVRARTIISMFYNTGVRLAELIGMDDGDVDYVRKQVTVTGKRDKQRIIPLGDKMLSELKHYIAMRDEAGARAGEALFVNDKGERISRAQVTAIVKQGLSRVTTQKKRSPHVLRHTFATAMLNDDAGIESVRLLLGHAGLEATEIYTHVTFEQLRAAYDKAHPRSD